MSDAAPNPAAVRQRRHRDRRKHGRFVVPVEQAFVRVGPEGAILEHSKSA